MSDIEAKWLEDKFTPGQEVWGFKNALHDGDASDFRNLAKFQYTRMYRPLSPTRWCRLKLEGNPYPWFRREEFVFGTRLEALEAAHTHSMLEIDKLCVQAREIKETLTDLRELRDDLCLEIHLANNPSTNTGVPCTD